MPKSSDFTVDISACKLENDDGTYDPDGDSLVCADGAYVQGNLGGLYNELDLVPHRIRIEAKKSAVIPAEYELAIGADNLVSESPLTIGYDASVFVDATGCTVTFPQDVVVGDFGIGGGINQAVQVVDIEQTADECVIDFVLRLAITSSNITGSSNRSFVIAGGAESLPIPNVEDPFLFSKTMTGTQGSEYDWSLTKSANPTSVNFGDTCEKNPSTDYAGVDITVGWTRTGPIPSGNVSIGTIITLDNPSLRTLKFDIEDTIYDGETPLEGPTHIVEGTCPGAAVEGDLLVIPPNASVQCALSWTDVPYSAELALNDIAMGEIIDPIIGDINELGQATADAVIQPSGDSSNATAVVTDTEWIVGDNFQFLVNSVTSGGTVPGTGVLIDDVDDPSSIDWTSDPLSGSGSVTLSKRIFFLAPKASTGGLRDTASLTASDGLTRDAPDNQDGYLEVDIETNPLVDLTIQKTIPYSLDAGDAGDPNSITFTFDIDGPASYTNQVQIVFEKPESGSSDTTLSTTVNNLAPGTYTVTETAPIGWAPTTPNGDMKMVTMSADTFDDCAGTAAFDNEPNGDLVARAIKVTAPATLDGSQLAAGWTMVLEGPGAPQDGEKLDTVCTGQPAVCSVTFATQLQFGSYTISEVGMNGWEQTGSSGSCAFDVTFLDLIFGKTYTCTLTNTQNGKVTIEKNTIPAGESDMFAFTEDITDIGSFMLNGVGGTDVETFLDVSPDSYTVSETDPSPSCDLTDNPCTEMWDLVAPLSCTDDFDSNGYNINSSGTTLATGTASIELDPGEHVYCTFTNQLRGQVKVNKSVSGVLTAGYQFDIRSGNATIASDTSNDQGMATFGDEYFLPGDYALCEQEVDAGWLSSLESDAGVFYPLGGDNSYVCVPFTLAAGDMKVFDVENTPPPGGNARTIGYWRNWSGDCTNGNQEDKLSLALAGGVTLGSMTWPGGAYSTCDAVEIIRKRNLSGDNRAFDPAYALASQYFAYLLNVNAGANPCGLGTESGAAQTLLAGVGFNGVDPDAGGKKKESAYVKNKDKAQWMNLASLFDAYNNNDLACAPPP